MTLLSRFSDEPLTQIPPDAVQVTEDAVPIEVRRKWRLAEQGHMQMFPPTHLDIIRLYYFSECSHEYVHYCGFNTVVNGELAYTDFVATAFRKRES